METVGTTGVLGDGGSDQDGGGGGRIGGGNYAPGHPVRPRPAGWGRIAMGRQRHWTHRRHDQYQEEQEEQKEQEGQEGQEGQEDNRTVETAVEALAVRLAGPLHRGVIGELLAAMNRKQRENWLKKNNKP